MSHAWLQIPRQSWLRRRLHRRLRPELAPDPRARSMVVAPHQDDEVLGCGGVILHKTDAGTLVDLIFMTDGSTSHRRFIPAGQLAGLRREEALHAARVLGVPDAQVHFLGHPDGRLHTTHMQAVAQVARLLISSAPEEIYVPYRRDGTPDHESTYRIVSEAVAAAGFAGRLFEYPVWFWNQWPWVAQSLSPNRIARTAAVRAIGFGLGWVALREFRAGAAVADVLERKRLALSAHVTQVSRAAGHPDWPILADVSGGQFLEALLSDHEVFRAEAVRPGR